MEMGCREEIGRWEKRRLARNGGRGKERSDKGGGKNGQKPMGKWVRGEGEGKGWGLEGEMEGEGILSCVRFFVVYCL